MKKLLFAICVLFSVLGNAQTWTNYYPKNDYVTSIAIDKQGNKWLVSGKNFSKFDGTTWTDYPLPIHSNNYTINSIYIDDQDNKWICTINNGILKFDGTNWTRLLSSEGPSGNGHYMMAIDAEGNIWIAKSGGVSKFDGKTWTNYTNQYEMGSNVFYSVAIDDQGNKWFGSYNGITKFDGTNWTIYNDKGVQSINSIAKDKQGNMWFGGSGGILKFNGYSWTTYGTKDGLPSGSSVTSIAIDNKGDKWFSLYGVVLKFDGTKWTEYRNNPQNQPSTIYNGIPMRYYTFAITVDAQGNKWFGTDLGLSKFNDTTWVAYGTNPNKIIDGNVRSIAIDYDGNKWFGTNNGVSKFDGTNWTNYNNVSEINSIAIDGRGDKWFGSSFGLWKFDGLNWTKYFDSPVKSIVTDVDGNIVMAGQYGPLFSGYGNSDFTTYTSVAIDAEGNKWVGTLSNGVYKFDGTNWTNYKTSNGLVFIYDVTSIAIDQKGNKWFGTSNGVFKFDGIAWTTYKTTDGLPSNGINTITIDSDGNKWFGTKAGVSKFDGIAWKNFNTVNWLIYKNVSAIAIDGNGNKWFGTGYPGTCDSYCGINGVSRFSDGGAGPLNTISKVQKGLVFHDQNGNRKKDRNESNISGQIVKTDNNYTTTQNNGLFYISLNNGSHNFTYRPQANWKLTTDSLITVTVTDASTKDTLYFGVQAIANKHEVETKLTGTATRAGFQSKSWINYANLGTLAENGTVSYTIADEASLLQSIPVADSVIGKRLVWKYSNLIPNEQRQISIITQMPGVNSLGDTLVSISKIKSGFSAFSDTLKQVLTGSYDPNDKLVAQGIGSKGYVLFGKELEYTVRFQNTGTDTAFHVNIRDTLDLNMDVASLQIVASSHPVKLDLRGQNEASFHFENIKLPHQKRDTLGSNGFVKYTIRPKKGLAENTAVTNKAYIYFDFNPAIITNQTLNTYVSFLSSPTGIDNFGFQSNKSASIFPNPAKDEFTIVFPQTGTYEISLANIQGKSIKTWNEIIGQETTLSVEGVEPGMYLYTAQGRNGQKYMGKLVVGR